MFNRHVRSLAASIVAIAAIGPVAAQTTATILDHGQYAARPQHHGGNLGGLSCRDRGDTACHVAAADTVAAKMAALSPSLDAIVAPASAAPEQQEADAYTRYELLAPATHRFRITYEITASTPGATDYYNPIRPGSVATDERVTDRATGAPLAFREVDGAVAARGGVPSAKPSDRYIAVHLRHPVPPGGGARLLIEKTYLDAASYHPGTGDEIVFERSLGIKRNAVVLLPGYILATCNYPSQVLRQADGRIEIAFWNDAPGPAPLRLVARPGVIAPGSSAAAVAKLLDERAHQNRNIVYSLDQPETHSFALTHDYTESRTGIATYVNVVRAGSTARGPSATDLDTGERLRAREVRGAAVRAAEPDATDVTADTVAILFDFAPGRPGASRRLRIAETYTDPERYGVIDGELVWHRSLGRADNAVILPAGWVLTNSSAPATVSTLGDGRIRLDFINPRTDEVDTVITARRRS